MLQLLWLQLLLPALHQPLLLPAPTTKAPTLAPTSDPVTSMPTNAPSGTPTSPTFSPTQKKLIFVNLGKNYADADAYCQKYFGTHLGTVNSSAKQTNIESLALGAYFWIGLNDNVTPGTWVWESTGVETTYTHWSTLHGQPDNYSGNEHCVHVWIGGYWNDANCASKFSPFVCDRKPSTLRPARG